MGKNHKTQRNIVEIDRRFLVADYTNAHKTGFVSRKIKKDHSWAEVWAIMEQLSKSGYGKNFSVSWLDQLVLFYSTYENRIW
jgi:hypothetical protein